MIGIDYWPKNRKEWHKGYVRCQKLFRIRDKMTSKIASKEHESFKDAKEIADSILHTKGAYYPSWRKYKNEYLKKSSQKALTEALCDALKKGV